jgi:integrase
MLVRKWGYHNRCCDVRTESVDRHIMPKKAKELSATEVRRLTRPGLHAVGGVAGLLLSVKPTGARSWILRVNIGDRRRDVGLGGFPDVPLAHARDRARATREQIRHGIDPVESRRAARAALVASRARALTFDQAAGKFMAARRHEFKSTKHIQQWENTLLTYASPLIGALPIGQVELAHVVSILEPIWTTKSETASRLRGRIERVLDCATVGGYRKGDNPARWKGNLDAILPRPSRIRKVQHHRALPWKDVPTFIGDLKRREGMGARALEFLILTAARSGEVRFATWNEIDLDARLWIVPADRMKAGKIHKIPLTDDAVAFLEALPRIEGVGYVFTAPRGGPLSDMSISAVTKRMGVNAVPHGFRSSFKDWARSATSYPDEVSELALAHVNSDATRAAYARDELLAQRRELMNDWAQFCLPASG